MTVVVRMVSGDKIVLSGHYSNIKDYAGRLINTEFQNTVSIWEVNKKFIAIYSKNIESIREI